MTDRDSVRQELPLTEVAFLILVSLLPLPKHGYAIMKDVQALSKGRVVLSTGTLYGALKRLLGRGWIRRAEQGPGTGENGRKRKAYALTDLGRRVLDAEVERLQSLASVARLRAAEEGI